MIKLIVTDIDGTLIQGASSELYPEIVEEIRRQTDRGVLVACAGGRPQESIANLFREVEDRIASALVEHCDANVTAIAVTADENGIRLETLV